LRRKIQPPKIEKAHRAATFITAEKDRTIIARLDQREQPAQAAKNEPGSHGHYHFQQKISLPANRSLFNNEFLLPRMSSFPAEKYVFGMEKVFLIQNIYSVKNIYFLHKRNFRAIIVFKATKVNRGREMHPIFAILRHP